MGGEEEEEEEMGCRAGVWGGGEKETRTNDSIHSHLSPGSTHYRRLMASTCSSNSRPLTLTLLVPLARGGGDWGALG